MINPNLIQYIYEQCEKQLGIYAWGELKNRYALPFSSNQNILIVDIINEAELQELVRSLLKLYDEDKEIWLFNQPDAEFPAKDEEHLSLQTLKNKNDLPHKEIALFIPASNEKNSMLDFQELIAHLRSEKGCPWDREQTHRSLRPNLLEETFEVLHAIDIDNVADLQEELGDLLLQIVLHSQIALEDGEFNLEDVISGIERKLIYRHPHIFGDTLVSDAGEVIKNWEVLKAAERKTNHKRQGMLHSVPVDMPALTLAQSYQKRAARVGFDWETIEPVKLKVQEELTEVETAQGAEERAKELGDVLFAMVNLIRWYGVDAESALREAAGRFASRFEYIEECVQKQGKTFADYSLVELDTFWDEAKRQLK
jgi:tetrapyrrole methylase family protein/MazG family protein